MDGHHVHRPWTLLDIPYGVYAALRALLTRANCQHAFVVQEEGEILDLHGLALRALSDRAVSDITVSTVLSATTKQGKIEVTVNADVLQMDLEKAREVLALLQGAIEVATADELIYRFLTDNMAWDADRAGAALTDFRDLRQRTRGGGGPHDEAR